MLPLASDEWWQVKGESHNSFASLAEPFATQLPLVDFAFCLEVLEAQSLEKAGGIANAPCHS
jgi:hypothetical protein